MNNLEIRNLIQETMDRLGVEVTDITEEILEAPADTPLFTIRTPDSHMLIGREGVGFQALNHLIMRIAMSKDPEVRKFTVDINGYYKESLEKIKQKARFGAERARSFQASIELEPMNAFERLIVHSLFPEGGDIKTRSEGAGSARKVVLMFVDKETF